MKEINDNLFMDLCNREEKFDIVSYFLQNFKNEFDILKDLDRYFYNEIFLHKNNFHIKYLLKLMTDRPNFLSVLLNRIKTDGFAYISYEDTVPYQKHALNEVIKHDEHMKLTKTNTLFLDRANKDKRRALASHPEILKYLNYNDQNMLYYELCITLFRFPTFIKDVHFHTEDMLDYYKRRGHIISWNRNNMLGVKITRNK